MKTAMGYHSTLHLKENVEKEDQGCRGTRTLI